MFVLQGGHLRQDPLRETRRFGDGIIDLANLAAGDGRELLDLLVFALLVVDEGIGAEGFDGLFESVRS